MNAAQVKAALIAAHRSGDEEAMRELSQAKEKLKRTARKQRTCQHPGCGVRVNKGKHCQPHANWHRYHRRKLTPAAVDDGD